MVVVLLVVVFITLLAPESESPLSGVQGPGEAGQGQPAGPLIYTGPSKPDGGGNGQGPGGNPGGGNPGGAPGGGAAGAPPAPGNPELGLTGPTSGGGGVANEGGAGGTRDEGGGGGNPSDDQYSNSLARLAMRLN